VVLLDIIVFNTLGLSWNTGLTAKRLDLAISLLARINDHIEKHGS